MISTKWVVFIGVIVILMLFWQFSDTFLMKTTSIKSMFSGNIQYNPLPVVGTKGWIQVGVEDSAVANTYVLELENGWLVNRVSGYAGGMAFVPKPVK